jgi:hypothetical protein
MVGGIFSRVIGFKIRDSRSQPELIRDDFEVTTPFQDRKVAGKRLLFGN